MTFSEFINFDDSEEMLKRKRKYGINRADPELWEVYDWFQARFLQQTPVTGGLFDLNRYYHRAASNEISKSK